MNNAELIAEAKAHATANHLPDSRVWAYVNTSDKLMLRLADALEQSERARIKADESIVAFERATGGLQVAEQIQREREILARGFKAATTHLDIWYVNRLGLHPEDINHDVETDIAMIREALALAAQREEEPNDRQG